MREFKFGLLQVEYFCDEDCGERNWFFAVGEITLPKFEEVSSFLHVGYVNGNWEFDLIYHRFLAKLLGVS